jgi:hypothetical protein
MYAAYPTPTIAPNTTADAMRTHGPSANRRLSTDEASTRLGGLTGSCGAAGIARADPTVGVDSLSNDASGSSLA